MNKSDGQEPTGGVTAEQRALGSELRRLRKADPSNLSQSAAAERLQVGSNCSGKSTISQFENGRRMPGPQVIERYVPELGGNQNDLDKLVAAAGSSRQSNGPRSVRVASDFSVDANRPTRAKRRGSGAPRRNIIIVVVAATLVALVVGALLFRVLPAGDTSR